MFCIGLRGSGFGDLGCQVVEILRVEGCRFRGLQLVARFSLLGSMGWRF